MGTISHTHKVRAVENCEALLHGCVIMKMPRSVSVAQYAQYIKASRWKYKLFAGNFL